MPVTALRQHQIEQHEVVRLLATRRSRPRRSPPRRRRSDAPRGRRGAPSPPSSRPRRRGCAYRASIAAGSGGVPCIAVRESSVAAAQRTRDHRGGGPCHERGCDDIPHARRGELWRCRHPRHDAGGDPAEARLVQQRAVPCSVSRSVADGAVRKMWVVPDANGRDHRREEEQSDERKQHKRPFSEALAPTTQFVRNAG